MKTKKKTKKPPKKTTAVAKLPPKAKASTTDVLPRGQVILADGTIRLKSGLHRLGRGAATYDVAGCSMSLCGHVLVASKDVDWLSIGKCQKCGVNRPKGVTITHVKDGHTVLRYICRNKKKCTLTSITYIQVHSPGRFVQES